jgi:hypothetical protein
MDKGLDPFIHLNPPQHPVGRNQDTVGHLVFWLPGSEGHVCDKQGAHQDESLLRAAKADSDAESQQIGSKDSGTGLLKDLAVEGFSPIFVILWSTTWEVESPAFISTYEDDRALL